MSRLHPSSQPSPRKRGEVEDRDIWKMGARRGFGIIFLSVCLALAGCGKKGAPQPPPDVPNTYPRPYPSE
jgi:hypothetical protein